jgi:hypothetical protein
MMDIDGSSKSNSTVGHRDLYDIPRFKNTTRIGSFENKYFAFLSFLRFAAQQRYLFSSFSSAAGHVCCVGLSAATS